MKSIQIVFVFHYAQKLFEKLGTLFRIKSAVYKNIGTNPSRPVHFRKLQ